MISYLNFLIEANLCLLVFLSFYFLFLKNETDFRFNRYFIVLSLFFSVLFPLIHLEGGSGSNLLPSVSNAVPTYWLPEYVLGGSEAAPEQALGIKIWNVLIWVYISGVLVFGLVFLIRLFRIIFLIYFRKKYTWNNCLVVISEENLPTFSFFNFIHLGHAGHLTDQETEVVLKHEWVHVKSFHTLDILLINLLEIIFWFNPFIRGYKKILSQLHEFEADARSVENFDLRVYCNLLAKVALQSADFSIANHFNKSLTIKRISMMQNVKSKIKLWKLSALALAFPATFFFVSCQDQIMEDVGEVIDGSTMALEYPAEVQAALEKLKSTNPNSNFNVLLMDDKGIKKMEDLQARHESSARTLHLIETPPSDASTKRPSWVILEFSAEVNRMINENAIATGKEVFTVVEEQPQPKGGMEVFHKYIGENLKYPAQARKLGIEGKVYVQFIVSDDGSLRDVTVIKGIGGGCDEEAAKVISQSETWIAGKQRGQAVNVRMVMPITFALN